ncbi:flagellar basal body-associated protein FliL [Alishewanella longhuensis]|uniref:Flagellar protein FliL n=1 Tax=Alishewanella longhuensis TaxID=1091037 RepID=A0ABQ3L5V2_9ALTE|nr:flagellar basal body-associated FliL family protein [Alishewanella longhuensis]GHG76298.1 flagellar basal body-associated protein FliL [Alishewanella longhuensis]
MKLLKLMLATILLLGCAVIPVKAQKQAPTEVVYYGFDPDIVTNYVADNRRTLGYVRVSVELMLPSRDLLRTIEYHEPIILDTIIGILSKQPEQKIKSLTGREEVRQQILEQLQLILKRETGQTMIQDVLFTKYLYQ